VLYVAAAASVVAGGVIFAAELMRVGTLPPGGLSVVLALGGLSSLCFGAGRGVRVLPHLFQGRVAAGRVTQRLWSGDDSAGVAVRYSVDGVEYEVKSVVASGTAAGDGVRVLYPSADPSDGQVRSRGLYVWPVVLIGTGVVFVCQWAIPASWPPGMDIPAW
jgi:hypothetical protein